MKSKYTFFKVVIAPVFFMALAGCVKNYLPEEGDAFDRDANFTTTVFKPVMGRTTNYDNIFNSMNSTLPMSFEILNATHASDGTPATELYDYYPIKVWKEAYYGTEKSIEEINAKRMIEYRRLFDIHKHSGVMTMWAEASSKILLCQPDSGYKFDVRVTNTGGSKLIKGMRLMPQREVEFEPSVYDPETGLEIAKYVTPETVYIRDEIKGYLIDPEDVHIYFRKNKDIENPNSTLTIAFYDKDWRAIDPRKFNETNWEKMFQAGFLKEINVEDKYVRYEMAYPLPLFKESNDYTDKNGEKAHIRFAASYLSNSNYRITSYMEFDFAIYKEAHWELRIHFSTDAPKLGEINN